MWWQNHRKTWAIIISICNPKSAQIRQQFTICPICHSWQILGPQKRKWQKGWALFLVSNNSLKWEYWQASQVADLQPEKAKGRLTWEEPVSQNKPRCGLESPGTTGRPQPWHNLTSPPSPVLASGAPSPAASGSSVGCGAARSSCQVTREMFVLTATRRLITLILDRLFEQAALNEFGHCTHE